MAVLQDRLRHGGMRLDRPAGDEEGRLQAELAQELQQLRRAPPRLIAPERHGDEAFGMGRVLAGPGALGIDVEGEEHGGPIAARPGEGRRRRCEIGRPQRHRIPAIIARH